MRELQAGAENPLLGDALVVLAQLLAATQFIVEEKYLAKSALRSYTLLLASLHQALDWICQLYPLLLASLHQVPD